MTLPKRLQQWLPLVQQASAIEGVDQFTVLAIMDRESLGGEALSPKGPAGTGDNGHGRGLMQIDDRAHPDFCSQVLPTKELAWTDPAVNIAYGCRVLKEALLALGYDYPAAICAYNAGVATAKKVSATIPEAAAPSVRLAAFDFHTTGHDYVSDVLARATLFREDEEVTPVDPPEGAP